MIKRTATISKNSNGSYSIACYTFCNGNTVNHVNYVSSSRKDALRIKRIYIYGA